MGMLHEGNIMAPKLDIKDDGTVDYQEVPRPNATTAIGFVDEMARGVDYMDESREATASTEKAAGYHTVKIPDSMPYVHMRYDAHGVDPSFKVYDEGATCAYLRSLRDISTTGVSFVDQVALLTGAGIGSINIELVKALVQGGATVVVTLFIRNAKRQTQLYAEMRSIYEAYGSKQSKMHLLPCNCSSQQDVANVVNYVYDDLKLDLDFVIPFAALAERGRDIGAIDSHSELAHRMMLTNLLRLLGTVKNAKEARFIVTRPALCIVPCSPNHGVFGMDGKPCIYARIRV
jgi:3-oxoacyl-ACP reductase-like protein